MTLINGCEKKFKQADSIFLVYDGALMGRRGGQINDWRRVIFARNQNLHNFGTAAVRTA